MESVAPSTRVRNFADTRPVVLDELENVIASLAIETARPQMGEMAREIAASLIGMGTEVWGDMRLYSKTDMRESGLRLPDAIRLVKLLQDNPHALLAPSPEPSGTSLGLEDSDSQETTLAMPSVQEEHDEEMSVGAQPAPTVQDSPAGGQSAATGLHYSSEAGRSQLPGGSSQGSGADSAPCRPSFCRLHVLLP